MFYPIFPQSGSLFAKFQDNFLTDAFGKVCLSIASTLPLSIILLLCSNRQNNAKGEEQTIVLTLTFSSLYPRVDVLARI